VFTKFQYFNFVCVQHLTKFFSIIIIIIITISYMQSIYTYIPETNYVPREYIVAAILLLVTIHGAYIVSFSVESIVLLH